MKKALVTGASGQLGSAIKSVKDEFKNLHLTFKSSQELDITNANAIEELLDKEAFDIIINTAAYTAVDKAETEPEKAQMINATAVKFLAESTNKRGITFIHISTDYVFDGSQKEARLESDQTNPIGVYGQTKLEGEQFALAINPKTIIIRTAWVYSKYGANFVKTMLRLFSEKQEIGLINDQLGSPTNAIDLARVIATIISQDSLEYGVFHYSNEGECTWYDFAMKIKELSDSSIHINAIPTSAYPTPAKRPAYSLLDKTKIKRTYHLEIPHWEESLKRELKTMI